MELTIISGLPDSNKIFATLREDRRGFHPGVSGVLNWLEFFGEPDIARMFQINMIWLGGNEPDYQALRPNLSRNVLFALVDPDGAQNAIEQGEKLLDGAQDKRIFNHPSAVKRTRRDALMARISEIPGVAAPKTLRVAPQHPFQVIDAIADNEMTWPVIVRSAGMHGGAEMALLDSPEDIAKLDRFAFNGESYYIIQYVDFRDEEGRYRKYRFVFIGDKIFLRHLITGETWIVHSGARVMTDETIALERTALRGYFKVLQETTMNSLAQIHRAVGLDFCGLDCAILDDGTIVPFEANPAMDIFRNTHPQYDLWDDMLSQSKRALLKLLSEPERWKSAT